MTNQEKHAQNFVHNAFEILSKNKGELLDQTPEINQFIDHDDFIHCSMIAALRLVENELNNKYRFGHPTTDRLMKLIIKEFSRQDQGFNDLFQYSAVFMQEAIENNNLGPDFDSFQKILGFWILYTIQEGELDFNDSANIENATIVGKWIANLFDDYWKNIPEY